MTASTARRFSGVMLMTMQEALTLQPLWVRVWLDWLMIGAMILPLGLFIWRQTRFAALMNLIAGVLGGVGTGYLYNRMGYVKLLGLPHIVVWTPLAIYYFQSLRGGGLPKYASWIMVVAFLTITISLAFDYTDVLRYILGNRTPMAMPPA
jgi:uncharacterized membrane protein YeaQ/YmgE (transglycosylase-associated protein family)